MWRGERGKAERARGRAGSETSGETIGKWMMTKHLCLIPVIVGENRKGPQSWRKGKEGDREHSSERESSTEEDEEPSPRRRDRSGIIYVFCFWFVLIKHPFVARHPWLPRPPSLNPEPYYSYNYFYYNNSKGFKHTKSIKICIKCW